MPKGSPRVALLTLGCAKNLVDSELIATRLADAGAEVVHTLDCCPVAIVNTCGFIQPAKQESIEVILDVAVRKQDGDLRTLIVTGCLSQRYGAELEELLPEVDVLTGIDPAGAAGAALAALGLKAPESAAAGCARRRRLTPAAWSYLRISHGCDNRCAYCAIPLIRGPLRSRPLDKLVEEARWLAADGVRELNVIAQDTASYGVDLCGERRVHELLRELSRIEDLRRVRLLYAHPAHLYDEMVRAVAEEEKICPYLDVPLQHVSDGVLRAMGRGVTRAQVEELIRTLRRRIPGVTLRTTFLTGFPGEMDADFSELLQFVREVRFERVGAFAYSREEGTRAAELPEQVPPEVAERRRRELMAAQQDIAFELAADRIGERTEVLMEEGAPLDGDLWPARSSHEAPDVDPLIYVHPPAPAPGRFARVEIVDAVGYDCIARVVEESDDGAS